jgi:hypothetical protein
MEIMKKVTSKNVRKDNLNTSSKNNSR